MLQKWCCTRHNLVNIGLHPTRVWWCTGPTTSTPTLDKIQSDHCFDMLVQERWNSSALAMELHLSWTNPSIYWTKIAQIMQITCSCAFLLNGNILILNEIEHFHEQFHEWKQLQYSGNYIWILHSRTCSQEINISPCDGLAPYRHQAIF